MNEPAPSELPEEPPLHDDELAIAGGRRRRWWFVGSLALVGAPCLYVAWRLWVYCGSSRLNCGTDGIGMIVLFAGLGAMALGAAIVMVLRAR